MFLVAAVAVVAFSGIPQRKENIQYTPPGYEGGKLYLDLYVPSHDDKVECNGECSAGVCAVFAHGGLWQTGSKDDPTTIQFGMNLGTNGVLVAAINYRLTTDPTCCSTDHTCDKGKCNGSCKGTFPSFVDDTKMAFRFLENEDNLPDGFKCTSFVCLGHSAGGQICGNMLLDKKDPQIKLEGVVGIEGIYNLSKFYSGPKGVGWECSVEKAFGSDGSLWCADGDVTCSPDVGSSQVKSLFIHSPQDNLTLPQQAQEVVCRLNGVTPDDCSCDSFDNCPCLESCLGASDTLSHYSSNVSGTHFGVLNTTQLADIVTDFVTNKCVVP